MGRLVGGARTRDGFTFMVIGGLKVILVASCSGGARPTGHRAERVQEAAWLRDEHFAVVPPLGIGLLMLGGLLTRPGHHAEAVSSPYPYQAANCREGPPGDGREQSTAPLLAMAAMASRLRPRFTVPRRVGPTLLFGFPAVPLSAES